MNDLIGKEDALEVLDMFLCKQCDLERTSIAYDQSTVWHAVKMATDALAGIGKQAAEPGWIPFKARELTDEEKEEHPDWDFIFDCQLPKNGQRILVSIDIAGHERVQFDEFYDDDGVYLDSGYEIGEEAVAWLPLPDPYKASQPVAEGSK